MRLLWSSFAAATARLIIQNRQRLRERIPTVWKMWIKNLVIKRKTLMMIESLSAWPNHSDYFHLQLLFWLLLCKPSRLYNSNLHFSQQLQFTVASQGSPTFSMIFLWHITYSLWHNRRNAHNCPIGILPRPSARGSSASKAFSPSFPIVSQCLIGHKLSVLLASNCYAADAVQWKVNWVLNQLQFKRVKTFHF